MHTLRWGMLVRTGRPFLLALLCVLSLGHQSGLAEAANCVPQPGAVAKPYVTNGASPQDRHQTGWPTLPSTAAVTFKRGTIRAIRLEPSTARPIIRIWGGSAGVAGRFWSDTDPPTKRAFYGRSAVQYSWNSAELPILQRQADELARISGHLRAATARLPDKAAQQVTRLLAAQLVGTARLIDDAVPLLEQHSQAASQMLEDVVDWAYRLSAG